MANTTWSPTDKSAGITLTGGNLIATNSGGGTNSVRALDKQVTGKFYWECTCNTISSVITGVGIHAGWVSFVSGGYSSAVGTCGVIQSGGGVYVDGSHSGQPSLGALVAGNVICVAVDAGARLIWFRVGAAGNWNGSAANNPATGVGGVPFTSLGIGIQIYPSAVFGTISDQVTANFGDTAFTGAVPAGFTSGFTAGAVIGTNELASQIAAEHWASMIPPQMQATQTAIEHWASLNNLTTRMLATQAAIEQWSPVTSAVAAVTRQAALTVVT
jgi:hypothetical protein